MEDLRWDHAVAAMVLILELINSDVSKAELAGKILFVILEAIKRYESEAIRASQPSIN